MSSEKRRTALHIKIEKNTRTVHTLLFVVDRTVAALASLWATLLHLV